MNAGGGSMSARIPTAVIPILPLADYVITSRVKTQGLNNARARLVDEFLSLFGGRMQPVMAQLIEAGNLTPKDVADAEKLLKELAARKKREM